MMMILEGKRRKFLSLSVAKERLYIAAEDSRGEGGGTVGVLGRL